VQLWKRDHSGSLLKPGCDRELVHVPRCEAALLGRAIYRLLPLRRRIVMANLRRAFGDRMTERELIALAQRFYMHLYRSALEYMYFTVLSPAKRAALVCIENKQAVLSALGQGKGALILAGHLGNWEIGCAGGIANFPELRGRLHVVRRPIVPRAFDRIVVRRFHNAGLGVIAKKDSMRTILRLLAANHAVGFVMDQHCASREGVRVNFFGSPAWTFRSLAVVARRSGSPVVPVATWRQRNGTHVLRFEEALPMIECDELRETIRANTQLYNDTLERLILRHPEQWLWMHRRWKHAG
jgi:KDO2-lipid IV(A) lauroyltransferase